MGATNPFNVDAALASERELAQWPPQGGAAIRAFCGAGEGSASWEERGVCVLKARKGFGKSHLLALRSMNHRDSSAAASTLFYPQGGHPRLLVDALSSLHAVVPRWLQGKEATAAWVQIWQLSILGLLVWITNARSATLRGYSDWFGSLEQLDQIQKEHRPDSPDTAQPGARLTWFMGRILERLPFDDFNLGNDQLKQGLYHGSSDWAIAITSSISHRGRTRIAMYLDAPDELVELDRPNLWRNVQQGFLLAIWKFSKNSTWSRMLNIYASVRSEAFGSGHDHPDVALAMGLVMSLTYNRDQLESILNDRIRQVDPARMALPLRGGVKPVHSFCGFSDVTHDDRKTPDGGRYVEDVFDSILRHTRMVPREVIAIGGAIYEITGPRDFDTVRKAVNSKASSNIQYAISHSFLGWSEGQHGAFAASLQAEVLDGKAMGELLASWGQEGPGILKFFVQHGLLGIAEPVPRRHRHYYQQRFAFDEVHGNDEASSVSKDYFFLHPAFKEWLLAQPARLNKPFDRLEVGVVGDLKPFEAKPPLVRLGIQRGKVMLHLRTSRRLAAIEKGVAADSLKVLFGVLWACRELNYTRINLGEFMEVWTRLRSVESIKVALQVHIPGQADAAGDKIRDWAKKINQDRDIRELQQLMGIVAVVKKSAKGRTRRTSAPFLSVSLSSDLGTQPEMWFPHLTMDEVDWDDAIYSFVRIGVK